MGKKGVNLLARLLLVAVIFGLLPPLAAQAEDTDARIKRLEAAVNTLQRELAAIKAERQREAIKPAPVVDQRQLERLVRKTFEQNKSDFGAVPAWVQNMKWGGNFRYRYEGFDDTDNDTNDKRNRNRVRARFGFKAKVNDEWDAIFRLASGSSESPTSTNQTLGEGSGLGAEGQDAFSSKAIWLDLAYADWHPEAYDGLNVYMGKMKMPFYRVGKNQVIWDSDVNPEGIVAGYKHALTDSVTAHLAAGGFWLEERKNGGDASLFGFQTYTKQKLGNGTHLLGGLSYYDFGNIDNKGLQESLGTSFRGNTATGASEYRYDYDILEGFAEYGFKCGPMPVAVFGNYVENLAAPNNRNTAYSVGFKLNKAKKPGSWQFVYSYRDVESDAVFAGLNDSDFIDGGTDGVGHTLGYKYQLAKNVQAALTLFLNERKRPTERNEKFERLQADLIFKF